MIDCTTYKVSNIRPFPGEVLLEILPPPTMIGEIHIPETYPKYVENMGQAGIPDRFAQEALVRKIAGPAEFNLGDRVLVRKTSGRQINQPPRVLKLVKAADILAVFV